MGSQARFVRRKVTPSDPFTHSLRLPLCPPLLVSLITCQWFINTLRLVSFVQNRDDYYLLSTHIYTRVPLSASRGMSLVEIRNENRLRKIVRLVLIFTFALLTLVGTPTAGIGRTSSVTQVPSNWSLNPAGLTTGDQFRLLLVSKSSMVATSTDISDYDDHLQDHILDRGHGFIRAYSGNFKVLGSTATTNVRTHTGTTGSGGVPIYWFKTIISDSKVHPFASSGGLSHAPFGGLGIGLTAHSWETIMGTSTMDPGRTRGMPGGRTVNPLSMTPGIRSSAPALMTTARPPTCLSAERTPTTTAYPSVRRRP